MVKDTLSRKVCLLDCTIFKDFFSATNMYYKVPEYAQKGDQLAVWAMPKSTFFFAVASQMDQ